MKDVAGKELKVGDKVASMFHGYSTLHVVEVMGFTEKKIRVKFRGLPTTKFPDQVALVESA